MQTVLAKTNNSLLLSDINTELSGSTVVVVLIYKQKILCFNVGDSRAILIKQMVVQPEK
jgi:serine/threonine protein phosphatase PrpC